VKPNKHQGYKNKGERKEESKNMIRNGRQTSTVMFNQWEGVHTEKRETCSSKSL
jgi:hypothetical protein